MPIDLEFDLTYTENGPLRRGMRAGAHLASSGHLKPLVTNFTMNHNIINHLSTGILTLDHQLTLIFINESAESLLELSAKRAIGQKITQLTSNGSAMEATLFDALQSNQPYTQRNAQVELGSGSTLTMDITISPFSENEWPQLLIELHPLNRYLRIDKDASIQEHHEVNRMMIRGLAHEIKNPLGGIRGAAELLKAEIKDAELLQCTDIIIEESDRLTDLVDQLLGPKTVPKMALNNIHIVMERTRKLIEMEAPENLTIVRDYDPGIPELLFDTSMMTQAILNIMRNAMQSVTGTEHPQITLSTRTQRQFTIASIRHKNVLRIDISDNGPGIPPSLEDHLFYPMISGRSGGTGLGLSFAHAIIHQHQGLVEFTSEPGNTTFTIILPLGDQQ